MFHCRRGRAGTRLCDPTTNGRGDLMRMSANRTAARCPALFAGTLASLLLSLPARAQDNTPPPPPAEPAPPPAPAAEPPPAPAAVPAPAPAAAPAPAPAPAPAAVLTEAKPPAFQHKKMDPPAIWF